MEWISVKDRLPPNELYVVVALCDSSTKNNMCSIHIAARYNDAWIDDKDGDLIPVKYGRVKYWMPLPDKPREKK